MKEELLKAISKLIAKYNFEVVTMGCALCDYIVDEEETSRDCPLCPNIAFENCMVRSKKYKLGYGNEEDYPNLVEFWTAVYDHIKDVDESEIYPRISTELQNTILDIAKPWKNKISCSNA